MSPDVVRIVAIHLQLVTTFGAGRDPWPTFRSVGRFPHHLLLLAPVNQHSNFLTGSYVAWSSTVRWFARISRYDLVNSNRSV